MPIPGPLTDLGDQAWEVCPGNQHPPGDENPCGIG